MRAENMHEVSSDQFKIAALQFEHLLKTMDTSHDKFIKLLESDPSINRAELYKNFSNNYTRSLQKLRLDVKMNHDASYEE